MKGRPRSADCRLVLQGDHGGREFMGYVVENPEEQAYHLDVELPEDLELSRALG